MFNAEEKEITRKETEEERQGEIVGEKSNNRKNQKV